MNKIEFSNKRQSNDFTPRSRQNRVERAGVGEGSKCTILCRTLSKTTREREGLELTIAVIPSSHVVRRRIEGKRVEEKRISRKRKIKGPMR
jgi:hypothetical protein